MGVASISPALPKMQEQLGITEEQVAYLITVFTLPGIFLTLILGVLADRFGRKTILIPSLLTFGIAGGLCAFMPDFEWLLILRFLQGVGASALGSLNVTIIGDLFAPGRRATVMGYNASVLSVGTASYPAIGGALALLGWNFPFLLALLAIPVGLWIMHTLKLPRQSNEQDFLNYLKDAMKSIMQKEALTLFLISVITFIILYGALLTYFPFLVARKFSPSPLVIGFLMTLMSFGSAFMSSNLGRLRKYFHGKTLLLAAFSMYFIACSSIPYINSIWLLIVPVLLFGAAQGCNLPNVLTMLSDLAPVEYRAAFMSWNGTVLRLGQTLGPLLMGLVYAGYNLEGVYGLAAALAALMFVLAATMIRRGRGRPTRS